VKILTGLVHRIGNPGLCCDAEKGSSCYLYGLNSVFPH
jgi:hypothetical protein